MSLKRHIFIALLFVLNYQVLIVILDLVTLHSLACSRWLLFISPQENLATSQFDSICPLLVLSNHRGGQLLVGAPSGGEKTSLQHWKPCEILPM